jgi:predicted peptidase
MIGSSLEPPGVLSENHAGWARGCTLNDDSHLHRRVEGCRSALERPRELGAAIMSPDNVSKRAFLWIAPLCAIIACATPAVLPIGAAAQDDPSITLKLYARTLERAGEPAVSYVIAIPPNYSPATPVPLILALHFGVGAGDATGAGGDVLQALVAPALAELGAIMVAPDSVRGNWSTPENERAVNALLDMVVDKYAIDRKRIVVTGYSMGGTGSWHFAEKFPDRFSAAIPIASRPPASASKWRLPVLAIHSDADQVAPFAPVKVRVEELQKAGVNAKMIALGGVTHYQVARFRGALHQAIPWLQEVWK